MSANKSALYTIGSYLGKGAAYAVQGTALGTSHLAQGAKAGYVAKAEELRARRDALLREALAQPEPTPEALAQPEPTPEALAQPEPTPVRQRKLATAK